MDLIWFKENVNGELVQDNRCPRRVVSVYCNHCHLPQVQSLDCGCAWIGHNQVLACPWHGMQMDLPLFEKD